MFKKITMLAASAVAAVALAAPASAIAQTEWFHVENGPLANDVTIALEGPAAFNAAAAGVDCNQVTFQIRLDAGSNGAGEVTSFTVTNPATECQGTGLLASCIPAQPTKEGTWSVTATNNGTITINGVKFKSNYSNCGSTQIEPGSGDVVATPDNREEIGNLTLGGTVATPLGSANITGSLTVESPNKFTYGF